MLLFASEMNCLFFLFLLLVKMGGRVFVYISILCAIFSLSFPGLQRETGVCKKGETVSIFESLLIEIVGGIMVIF